MGEVNYVSLPSTSISEVLKRQNNLYFHYGVLRSDLVHGQNLRPYRVNVDADNEMDNLKWARKINVLLKMTKNSVSF